MSGSLVYDAHETSVTHFPTVPVTVADPTGAGDAFCGGFLSTYIETGDAVQSAVNGSVSASFAIASIGAFGPLKAKGQERDARARSLAAQVNRRLV